MPTVEQRRDILNRLKSVDGHLRGVLKMVEEDAYCMDVIKQLQAVQGAIGRVNALLLQDHLQTCVTTAIRGDVPSERERVIGELLRLFEQDQQTPIAPPGRAASPPETERLTRPPQAHGRLSASRASGRGGAPRAPLREHDRHRRPARPGTGGGRPREAG